MSLANKVAVVTGASSSRGIGFAAASKLAGLGATVVIADVEQASPELDLRAQEINEGGGACHALGLDVTDQDQVKAFVDTVVDEHGGIDVLFNNAGVGFMKKFEDATLVDFDRNYQVNVRGTVALTMAVLPVLKSRGGGSIINNASIGGLYADPYFTAYDMSKFAVVGFTKSLALELGEYAIRVNAICPGFTDTEMADKMPEFFANQLDISVQEARKMCYDTIAMKRPAQTSEIAELVAFLAGPGSSYITGAAIPVAGGFPQAL